MDEERLPQCILNLIPAGRRKRGRPKDGKKAYSVMEECGLRDADWEDRLRWRLGVEIRRHTS
jgi:hypothetical protein